MFEATLSSSQPDRLRTQRLLLATLISVGMTSVGIAGAWTLERLGIERVDGPRSTLDLVEYSLVAPKVVKPPPPPPDIENQAAGGAPGPESTTIEERKSDSDIESALPSKRIPDVGSPGNGGISIGGGGCPPPLCSGLSKSPGTGPGTCVGPNCGVAKPPAAAPAEVAFSSLRCVVCPDPDRAELRRTPSALRKRSGSVGLRFCVDANGRVESSSIDITESFGDVAVDRITRATVATWRFKPMEVAGTPRRACSETTYRITFD